MASYPYKPDNHEDVKLWRVYRNKLVEVEKQHLDLEEKLEQWIVSDPSVISPSLLIIGRQVETNHGGVIDLLAMDDEGDLVVIELKHDNTPRDAVAQILDYASWVSKLTPERIQDIAGQFNGKKSLEASFTDKFKRELPESLNNGHRMLVVGSRIDAATRRIINYLSESHGVDINAATFSYYKESAKNEFLTRSFLIEEEPMTLDRNGKRRKRLSFDELKEIADTKNVGTVYDFLLTELQPQFNGVGRTRSSLTFRGRFRDTRSATILSLLPSESDPEKGLSYQLYMLRFREYFDLTEETALELLPPGNEPWTYGAPGDQASYEEAGVLDQWSGYTGFINYEDAEKFVDKLKQVTGYA